MPLRLTSPDGSKSYDLRDGVPLIVGRAPTCDLHVFDPTISRRHAELRRAESGDWEIADLGSTNGIKVNGRRVDPDRPQSIKPGDVIELGTSRAVFELE